MSSGHDSAARQQALDVQQSFIVQAPAGSGKTELLTDRFLALLSVAQSPEEIIAITFTRDAAAEMRARIVAKLHWAKQLREQNKIAELPHQRTTQQLANAVLDRDQALNWQLLAQPARLRVQTIDALCAGFTRQMPYLSRLGGQADVLDKAQALYEQAARLTLQCLEDPTFQDAIGCLMRQCDNNADSALRLIVDMLQKRDQWLPLVVQWPQHNAAEFFTALVRDVAQRELTQLLNAIPLASQIELRELAAIAVQHVDHDSEIAALAQWTAPLSLTTPHAVWLALRCWLLTRDGSVRSRVDKNCGFPAELKAPKQRFQSLLKTIADENWAPALARMTILPNAELAPTQWQDVERLFSALKLAVAQLRLLFAERGQIDFIEIAQAALLALGDDEHPTDLALSLDYRIQHLLVDEFQDTSRTQWVLLQKLLSGWQYGDGRTVFLVGDPMQSIYRFRKAEVALFLRAQQHGITPTLPLQALTLTRNFRSQAGIIDWLNQYFPQILPTHADAVYSAVPYVKADATQERVAIDAVQCHLFVHDNGATSAKRAEADRVVQLVQDALRRSDGEIAVLVRARTHLNLIIAALQRANIAFSAVDIASLADAPLINDLQQLTRALWHLGDRLAWLTVLRAPWCGLQMADLHALCGRDTQLTVFEQLQRADLTLLSSDGLARFNRVWPILQTAVVQQDALSLAQRVEACWRALHGDAVLQSDEQHADAEQFFCRLYASNFNDGDVLQQIDALSANLYAQSNATARVKLMTMHKSKGLEFDTVIVPGLDRKSAQDGVSLLAWEDYFDEHGEALLVGPYEHRADRGTGMSRYIRAREKIRAIEESKRLLYVTATRAKRQLHWLACVGKNGKGEIKAGSGSLLALLWPSLEQEFLRAQHTAFSADTSASALTRVPLTRIASNWTAPLLTNDFSDDNSVASLQTNVSRAGIRVRAIGTVTHAWLEQLSRQHLPEQVAPFLAAIRSRVIKQLQWQGLNRSDADAAVELVLQALDHTLNDPQARYLLQAHDDAHSEWAMTRVEENGFSQHIIDRSFIDEQGTRWIVDYKTATDDGGDWPAFLKTKIAEYTPQLKRYAELLAKIEQRPQKLVLYFPLQKQLVFLPTATNEQGFVT